MAYQIDIQKGFLEIDLLYKDSIEYIKEYEEIFDKIKSLNTIHLAKFEVKINELSQGLEVLEDVLFRVLLDILSEIETLSKNKFPVTVFWHYKNEEELEMGNQMNDLHDKHMVFEFLKID